MEQGINFIISVMMIIIISHDHHHRNFDQEVIHPECQRVQMRQILSGQKKGTLSCDLSNKISDWINALEM